MSEQSTIRLQDGPAENGLAAWIGRSGAVHVALVTPFGEGTGTVPEARVGLAVRREHDGQGVGNAAIAGVGSMVWPRAWLASVGEAHELHLIEARTEAERAAVIVDLTSDLANEGRSA